MPIASERDDKAHREDRLRKIAILEEAMRKYGIEPAPRGKTPLETLHNIMARDAERKKPVRVTEKRSQPPSAPAPAAHPDPNVDAQMKVQEVNRTKVVHRRPAPGSGSLDGFKGPSMDKEIAEARRFNRMAEEGNFDF